MREQLLRREELVKRVPAVLDELMFRGELGTDVSEGCPRKEARRKDVECRVGVEGVRRAVQVGVGRNEQGALEVQGGQPSSP